MPAVKKIVAKPAAPAKKPAVAAKKPAAAKKGGALEIAPIAAAGLLLAAQKMYKGMMDEQAAAPAKRARKARRGGDGPESFPVPVNEKGEDIPVAAAAPEIQGGPEVQAAPEAPEVQATPEAPADDDDDLPSEEGAAAVPETAPALPASSEETLYDAVKMVTQGMVEQGMSDDKRAELKAMLGGAKKARKSSAKSGGSAALVGAELQATVGGAKTAKPARKSSAKRGGAGDVLGAAIATVKQEFASTFGGAEALGSPLAMAGGKKARKPSAKRGGGALAPIAEVAGGMPLAPANTAPLRPEPTAMMAGGAKKAKATKKRMSGGELEVYATQLSKLTSQLRGLM